MTATKTVRVESPAVRLCLKCRKNPILWAGEKARYCAECIGRSHCGTSQKRQKSRKWVATDAIDEMIRDHYLKRVTNGGKPRTLPSLAKLGETIGWPKFAIQQRARKLGVTRAKESPWSTAELLLLEQLSYLTPERIRARFAKAGYTRSAAGINLQIKRKHLRSNHGFYSAAHLGAMLGVDPHAIARWINRGDLRAERRGTARTGRNGGDEWMLRDEWVRAFVVADPTAFDIRKVDQGWFINMLIKTKPAFPPLRCACRYETFDGRTFVVANPDCSDHGSRSEVSRHTAQKAEPMESAFPFPRGNAQRI